VLLFLAMLTKKPSGSEQSSPWVLAAYSGITMPMAAMGMPVAVYLPRFYSEGMGLSLATVGIIFTLARIWDVVTDPLMGMAIDKFETRWGRRKHWVGLSIPILMLSVWMVFMPNPDSVTPAYLMFWLLVLYIGYTMKVISHLSWGAELSTSYDARFRLFGWREVFTIAGMTIVLAIPAFLELTGDADQSSKAGAAFGVGVSFLILELVFGFQPGQSNSAEALDGLLITQTAGFALPMFLGYLALIHYPLTRAKHDEIVAQLQAASADSR
jgi:Na+/melibiose symporter-like transporter